MQLQSDDFFSISLVFLVGNRIVFEAYLEAIALETKVFIIYNVVLALIQLILFRIIVRTIQNSSLLMSLLKSIFIFFWF